MKENYTLQTKMKSTAFRNKCCAKKHGEKYILYGKLMFYRAWSVQDVIIWSH